MDPALASLMPEGYVGSFEAIETPHNTNFDDVHTYISIFASPVVPVEIVGDEARPLVDVPKRVDANTIKLWWSHGGKFRDKELALVVPDDIEVVVGKLPRRSDADWLESANQTTRASLDINYLDGSTGEHTYFFPTSVVPFASQGQRVVPQRVRPLCHTLKTVPPGTLLPLPSFASRRRLKWIVEPSAHLLRGWDTLRHEPASSVMKPNFR